MSVTGSASSTNNLNCLKGKISSLAPYAVDPTLSEEGAAAEAKAVGDALEKKVSFKNIVDDLNTSDAELPLSAKQGVVLRQSVEQLSLDTDEHFGNIEKTLTEQGLSLENAKTAAEDAQFNATTAQETADSKMSPDGSIPMTGDLDMGENKITNVADPEEDTDAVTKFYADTNFGGKTLHFEVTLSATGWASTTGSAPYFQEVDVADILSTDKPHWGLVHSDDTDTALAQKEAFAVVDDLDTADGSVTFTCFEDKPEVDLTIQLEVNR